MRRDIEQFLSATGEIGFVEKAVSSLVYARGLPGARQNEVVVFDSGEIGRVVALHESQVEFLSFSRDAVRVGSRAARTDTFLELPLGDEILEIGRAHV